MGFEGANVLFDSWVHPLMMGLEEHLLAMFREDPEFHDGVTPSHLGGAVVEPVQASARERVAAASRTQSRSTSHKQSGAPKPKRN